MLLRPWQAPVGRNVRIVSKYHTQGKTGEGDIQGHTALFAAAPLARAFSPAPALAAVGAADLAAVGAADLAAVGGAAALGGIFVTRTLRRVELRRSGETTRKNET